ncbi:hypothetical protein KFK09_004313 [Dendrobium nobile]|uniref:Uncharacterized protein n=1 Tax=Dendrobium nobile TaxID=94219 RepID=A0A8T3C2F8_DENNO|nr:hypothetical protein KFK09_004313 [Dendrobium nobile]
MAFVGKSVMFLPLKSGWLLLVVVSCYWVVSWPSWESLDISVFFSGGILWIFLGGYFSVG